MNNEKIYRIFFEGKEIRLKISKNNIDKIKGSQYCEAWLEKVYVYTMKDIVENGKNLEIYYDHATIIIEDYAKFLKYYSGSEFGQQLNQTIKDNKYKLKGPYKLSRVKTYAGPITMTSLLVLTVLIAGATNPDKKTDKVKNIESSSTVFDIPEDVTYSTIAYTTEKTTEAPTITSTTKAEPVTEPATSKQDFEKETTTEAKTTKETLTTKKKELINQYTTEYIKNKLSYSGGVASYNGHRETYYEQEVLPGPGLKIPGRHVSEDGTIRDEDGYICVASDYDYLPYGSLVMTTLGMGKVYDTGCAYGTIDIYVSRAPFKAHHP